VDPASAGSRDVKDQASFVSGAGDRRVGILAYGLPSNHVL
jgi:hypothetical protein